MTARNGLPSHFDFDLFRQMALPQHRLLLLDYDGTLAPFHAERSRALPFKGVREALTTTRKSPGSRTVVISGRPVAEVRELLGSEVDVEIWGAHGWERLTSRDEYTVWTPEEMAQLELRAAEVAARGIVAEDLIECKAASIAVHLRPLTRTEARRVKTAIHEEWSERALRTGLELMEFDNGLELRDPSRTKATAVDALLSESPSKIFAAYLGDDQTDEDAFSRIVSRGWALLISRQTRPSIATFTLCPPHEVIRFLEEWGAWSQTECDGE